MIYAVAGTRWRGGRLTASTLWQFNSQSVCELRFTIDSLSHGVVGNLHNRSKEEARGDRGWPATANLSLPPSQSSRFRSLPVTHLMLIRTHCTSPQWLLIATMLTSCINRVNGINYVYQGSGYTRVARGENGANCTRRSSFPSKLVTSIFRRIVVADYPALLRLSAAAAFNYDSKNSSFSILMGNFVLPAFQKFYRGNPNILRLQQYLSCLMFVVVFVFDGKKVS